VLCVRDRSCKKACAQERCDREKARHVDLESKVRMSDPRRVRCEQRRSHAR
jgi:hypothetical protein